MAEEIVLHGVEASDNAGMEIDAIIVGEELGLACDAGWGGYATISIPGLLGWISANRPGWIRMAIGDIPPSMARH